MFSFYSSRRRTKKEPSVTKSDEMLAKRVTDLEQQLSALQQEKEVLAKETAAKLQDFEDKILLEKSENAKEYAKRKELEQQFSELTKNYKKKTKDLERQISSSENGRANGIKPDSKEVGIQSTLHPEEIPKDVMKLMEEVETLNAEKRVHKQEMEIMLKGKFELEKNLDNLQQELIHKSPQTPPSAIPAVLAPNHRYEFLGGCGAYD